MKILCLGGGPAGLYFAISMKLRDPSHDVTVLERNGAGDTFGWGVVLSDDALSRLQKNDPSSAQAIRDHFIYWDDIAVIRDGHRQVSGGHGFAGIGRRQLLILLQGGRATWASICSSGPSSRPLNIIAATMTWSSPATG